MTWERDQAEEQIARDATHRPERVQQWREAVSRKYEIFWQLFTNPEDLTTKRNIKKQYIIIESKK